MKRKWSLGRTKRKKGTRDKIFYHFMLGFEMRELLWLSQLHVGERGEWVISVCGTEKKKEKEPRNKKPHVRLPDCAPGKLLIIFKPDFPFFLIHIFIEG